MQIIRKISQDAIFVQRTMFILSILLLSLSITYGTEPQLENDTKVHQAKLYEKLGTTLNVLVSSQYNPAYTRFEELFLQTPEAQAANIDDIVFSLMDPSYWDDAALTGDYDVAWGTDLELFEDLHNKDLLVPMTDLSLLAEVNELNDTQAGVPIKGYNATDILFWVGSSLFSYGFTINEDVLQNSGVVPTDYPKSWADLGDPTLWDKNQPLVAIANALDSTVHTTIYDLILQNQGWQAGWTVISTLAANAIIKGGATETINAVNDGQVGVGTCIDFFSYKNCLANAACKYVLPSNQTLIQPGPIALLPGNVANREEASAFIEFIISEDGQKIWMEDDNSRLPIRGDFGFIKPTGELRVDIQNAYHAVQNSQSIDFNTSLATTRTNTLMHYFEAVLTNAHQELNQTWSKLVSLFSKNMISNNTFYYYRTKLGRPFLNLSDAISINDKIQSNSTYREDIKEEWESLAKTRYLQIFNELDDPVHIGPPLLLLAPEDKIFEEGAVAYEMSWSFKDNDPESYNITQNDVLIKTGTWSSNLVFGVTVLDLSLGNYTYCCRVIDQSGHIVEDEVTIQVFVNVPPVLSEPTDLVFEKGVPDAPTNLTWSIADHTHGSYNITRNGTLVKTGQWIGNYSISTPISDLPVGTYSYRCTAIDIGQNEAHDEVMVTVLQNDPPILDSPADITYTRGSTGISIVWHPIDPNPDNYIIYKDNNEIQTGTWITDESISIDVDGLKVGTYTYKLIVYDTAGNSAEDEVIVTVVDPEGIDSSISVPEISIEGFGLLSLVFAITIVLYGKKRMCH